MDRNERLLIAREELVEAKEKWLIGLEERLTAKEKWLTEWEAALDESHEVFLQANQVQEEFEANLSLRVEDLIKIEDLLSKYIKRHKKLLGKSEF